MTTINGSSGNDSLTGTAANDTLYGLAGNDELNGGDGNDVLWGGEGNDTLYDSNGVDTLNGGAGDDLYWAYTSNTNIVEKANEGIDTVLAWAGGYKLGANLENLTTMVSGTFTGNELDNVMKPSYSTPGSDNFAVTLDGGAGNDTLTGGSVGDRLLGGSGNDTLTDQFGDDYLDGGLGADTMNGGLGHDTYVVDNVGDVITGENVPSPMYGTDIDTVVSSISYTLGSNLENLTLTGSSALNGTGNALDNVITGNSAANVLNGGAGNDTLNGGAGNDTLSSSAGVDTLAGGTGNDCYVLNAADGANEVIVENANEGTDTVKADFSVTLAANVENLTLTGTTAINGTGNTLNNVLTGNSAANVLKGGLGNDTYVIDAADTVTENANEGTDTIQAGFSYTLGNNLENLTLTGSSAINGTGNSLANVIKGNSANNVLNGGAGNDTLSGAAGNDTYVLSAADGSDVIVENANEGTDTVQVGLASYTLGANLENLTSNNTAGGAFTGNALNNVMTVTSSYSGYVTLDGGAGNDTLQQTGANGSNMLGGAGNDILIGSNGAVDKLDGGLGADTMRGGNGGDTYIVDNVGDVVVDDASAVDIDFVYSSVSYTLTDGVEKLFLTGTAALNGTGNTGNNEINGNDGNNTLNGGLGNDDLFGGAGNDTLLGGAGNDTLTNSAGVDSLKGGTGDDRYNLDANGSDDVIVENANEGTDTVFANLNGYTLGANLENLTTYGGTFNGNSLNNVMDAFFTATTFNGGAGNDTLLGSTNNDVLNGGTGNDTLDGRAGNDSLAGGSGNDTYLLSRGNGADSVTENDTTAGNTDVARFDATVTTDQLWFRHVGNNLEVSIIGTSDKLTMNNWYLGNQYHVEQFKTSNGKTLLDSQVNNLVNAMAAFAPPAAGQTTLPDNYAASLSPVIAANWQ
jgi:Ca2+-binding RTX toxin-like protein